MKDLSLVLLAILVCFSNIIAQDTEYFYEESDWFESQADAEYECWDLIDIEIDDFTDYVESNDGEVISTNYDSPSFEEEEDDDGVTWFKCSCNAEVEYILEEEENIDIGGRTITLTNLDTRLHNLVQNALRGTSDCPPGTGRAPTLLEIEDIVIASASDFIGRRESNGPPTQIKEKRFNNVNCTNTKKEKTYIFRTKVVKGSKISYSSTYKSRKDLKQSVNIKLYGSGGGLDRDYSEEMSFTNKIEDDLSTEVNYQETEESVIPPRMKQIALSSIENFTHKYIFQGKIIIDGTARIETYQPASTHPSCHLTRCPRRTCYTSRIERVRLSRYLNEAQRTFKYSGNLFYIDVTNYDYKVRDEELKPEDCDF